MIVISTAKDCPDEAERTAASVRAQTSRHIFACADEATLEAVAPWCDGAVLEPEGTGQVQALVDLIATCDPSEVVVWLDGDGDELASGALSVVEAAYGPPGEASAPWLTYGSFRTREGVRDSDWHEPFGKRYGSRPRSEPWRASHLRTFRAGLFQAIPLAFLTDGRGRLFESCTDRAIMLPMLEMAGERYAVLLDTLCYYNRGHGRSAAAESREHWDLERIHNMTGLARLDRAPWA